MAQGPEYVVLAVSCSPDGVVVVSGHQFKDQTAADEAAAWIRNTGAMMAGADGRRPQIHATALPAEAVEKKERKPRPAAVPPAPPTPPDPGGGKDKDA